MNKQANSETASGPVSDLTGLLGLEDMAMNKAKMLSDTQRAADKTHHEGRIKWLSGDSPKWACGTPLLQHEVIQMRTASEEALILINDHGMALNHAA